MRIRAKLKWMVGTATLAVVLAVAGSALLGVQQSRRLDDVESRLVPKLELEPRLESEFERLGKALQEAVAAEDAEALEETLAVKSRLFELVTSAGGALSPPAAAELRWSIQDYHDVARGVSARLIAGETGEALVDDVEKMQRHRAKVLATIQRTAGLDRRELSAGFAAIRAANQAADRFRLGIGLTALALLLGLSIWGGRGMLRTLGDLSSGFARFGTGDFARDIPVTSRDELGDVAKEANQMAGSLRKLADERDHHDWIKAGIVGLSDAIQGELEPGDLARTALWFLARHVGARAGAVYLLDGDDTLRLTSHYAGVDPDGEAGALASFRLGEGLVGQAAASRELLQVDDVPSGYFRVRSGLGEAEPRSLLILPLARLGHSVAVLELAFLGSSAAARELLLAVREALAAALEAARSRAALATLLDQSQAQARRLASQEEQLRATNEELLAQQEELKSTNEELESQRRALSQQNVDLDEARARLQQKAEELARVSSYKSSFLANMSHELRTPLNSMLLLSHLLGANDAGNLTPKQVLHCKTIHSAGQDLLALINQVLDLAKIESGRQEVHLERVELREFVAYAERVFEPMAADKGLRFVTEIAPDAPAAMTTDRSRVERILTNLLGNAIKFTDRGEVALRVGRPVPAKGVRRGAREPDGTVAFVVSDTGIGIPAHAQELVFAPFEQVRTDVTRPNTGTGLGLAISRESALLLGGDLEVESVPSQGTTFTCYLPENRAAQPAPRRNGAGSEPARRNGAVEHPASGPLLVIEDDSIFVEQLVDVIRAQHLDVLVARTGERGLELAREHAPRGIVLDVRLPDIDGWTVMERLRADPATRHVPVHFVSGVDARERGLSLGAIGYLMKPATHAELALAVRNLGTSPLASSRVLVVEDSAAEAEAITELLSREEFDVRHVLTGGAALEMLEKERFGCVILDLKLPDMDGAALLEALKTHAGPDAPRIVVHTGRALSRKETRQLEAYAEAVILKDGSSGERLLEEVRHFVQRLDPGEVLRPSSAPARRSEVSLDRVKVLLAEDDMRTVYALSALLAARGAEVVVAENGREALELLGRHPDVGVVLMDVMMPEMDGYEAMRRVREDQRFRALPILALTAKAMKGERERCLEAGATDYLSKPVDGEQLLAALGACLSS